MMGKQNRKVPVLLTHKLRLGIDLLISTRDKCGIDGNNQYVFAKVNTRRSFDNELGSKLKHFSRES